MKKVIIVSLLVLGGLISLSTFASQNKIGMTIFDSKDPVKMQAIQTALTNKDYSTWISLMSGNLDNMLKKIDTQEKFNKFVDMHNAMLSGDIATAKKLSDELGVGFGKFKEGKNGKFGSGKCMDPAKKQAIETAITNKNYTTRYSLMSGKNITKTINSNVKFLKYVDMLTAIKNKDQVTAKKLRDELGLTNQVKKGVKIDKDELKKMGKKLLKMGNKSRKMDTGSVNK
ncbi:MAG: hypothetical protein WC872_01270 [Candidatus Absconditabacterales bacterium]